MNPVTLKQEKKDFMVNGNSDGVAASGLRVLIVEDNADAAWIMGRLLGALATMQVESVLDGPAALEKLGVFRPHMVLLDIGLPRMDGFQLLVKSASNESTTPCC